MATRPCFSTTLLFRPSSVWLAKPRLNFGRSPRGYLSIPTTKSGRSYGSLRSKLPHKSWDSHMHVVEPRYPVVANAAYEPTPHTIRDAIEFETSLGIENLVLVQPSIYGHDNSCLLDALRHLGPSRGRGVVVIDPANANIKTLREWHALGVRGVRVNFRSSGKVPSHDELRQILAEQARVIRPLGWMVQVHTSMSVIPLLEELIPQLGVKVCIDHFGGPELRNLMREQGEAFDPYSLREFSSLISLLKAGRTYVKISAPYRLSKDKGYQDLEMMIREFFKQAPNRVLYATDWPHTRFSDIDIKPFTEMCLRACGSQAVAERVFRLNAEELMDCSLKG
ncbi:hypothetical protein BJX68DRAFT_160346 [Aspergillus pseudodeflectus]|uniref:Amidohydrolase-related domain-containing protein n=1 Tax=Aspergillus pseudodeflectus TaxID=176178 RepID=A0ABR4L0T6_9EURO